MDNRNNTLTNASITLSGVGLGRNLGNDPNVEASILHVAADGAKGTEPATFTEVLPSQPPGMTAEQFWYSKDVSEFPFGIDANHRAVFEFAEAYAREALRGREAELATWQNAAGFSLEKLEAAQAQVRELKEAARIAKVKLIELGFKESEAEQLLAGERT